MKKQVSPTLAAVIAVIAVLAIGGYLYFANRSPGGSLPTAEQAASGPKVGGKHLPGAAGVSGSSGGSNASGAQ